MNALAKAKNDSAALQLMDLTGMEASQRHIAIINILETLHTETRRTAFQEAAQIAINTNKPYCYTIADAIEAKANEVTA